MSGYVFEQGDQSGSAGGGIEKNYFITKNFNNFNKHYTRIEMSNGFGAEYSSCSIL